MSNNPLQYKRILVTRAKEQAASLSSLITERGGTPIEVPLLSFVANETEEMANKLKNIHTYNWIIFTSANGVNFFFSLLNKYAITIDMLDTLQIAAVGKKTEDAVRKYGKKVDIVPDDFVAEELIAALSTHIKQNERVLFPKGNLARDLLPNQLRAFGCEVEEIVVYENQMDCSEKERLSQLIRQKQLDVLTFTSSSAVNNFFRILDETILVEDIDDMKIACIGPIAATTAQRYGLTVDILASPYTIEGLVEAICLFYKEVRL